MLGVVFFVGLGCLMAEVVFFFFKQKTADEMRISDWSSDVCSSDLGFEPLYADQETPIPMDDVFNWAQGGDAIDSFAWPQPAGSGEIGRASCRERVCQYV